MLNSAEVKRLALEAGFDDCGIARADRLEDSEYPLREWLRRGWNASMGYMERNPDMRLDPRILVPGARSVICVVSAYPPPASPGGTAAFAAIRDYHTELKSRLFLLRERLGIQAKPCVDTVPIADKYWAARAGLGWIGRHTLLVTPRWGTWVNLGELVTPEECTDYDSPLPPRGRCDACKRCVTACPNHAIAPDGPPMLDASRCISFHTTQSKLPVPQDIDTRGYTFGCDLCQLACPFNQSGDTARI
ncbi:MAG: DUF1730 domain-containing protein [Bacteroidales bacterium]|nr:DUF1730 domain-containing protein [Bacteroidales bacterium]